MGIHKNVGFEKSHFPKQGTWLNKKVQVCFRYDTTKILNGEIVREDDEEPFMTIIHLEDGRYVMATECMYT